MVNSNVKTQQKVMLDFAGKKGAFPPVTPFFVLGKKCFFGFSENISKCFFNEIDCKKFANFFCNEFSSKKFFNSLKLTIKNFRNFFNEIGCKKFLNFFYRWIHCKKNSKFFYSQFNWKKIQKFFTANFIEKTFRKFLIVNFRLLKNFLLLNSLQKTIRKFFTVNFIEKTFPNFFRKS